MEKDDKAPIRKRRQLRVPVLPVEEADIKKLAAGAGLSVAAYLRNVGLGYQVRSILDFQCVEQLARINGDLGRLGGLLKLWLASDPRTAGFGEDTLRAILARIEARQDEMHEVMRCVVLPARKK